MPGNTVPAVFAIPAANRPGFTGYFIPTPPSSYRNQAWMSYAGENELPSQWADSVRPSLIPSQLYLLDTLQGENECEAETKCFVISGPLSPTRCRKLAFRRDSWQVEGVGFGGAVVVVVVISFDRDV